MDAGDAVAALVIGFVASAAQGLTGFGFALVAVPALLLFVDVQAAIVTSTLLATAGVVLVAAGVWRDAARGPLVRLSIGSVAGMPLGLAVLLLAPEEALRIGVAAFVMLSAVVLSRGVQVATSSQAMEVGVGVLSGVLRTSTSMAGPPVVIYFQGRALPPAEFRATLVVFLLAGNVVAVAAFAASGVVSREVLLLSAAGAPGVIAGSYLGRSLLTRVDAALFRALVLALLLATGLVAIGFAAERLLT